MAQELNLETCFTKIQHYANLMADTHKYILFGGARGGGKSRWLRWYMLRYILMRWQEGIAGVNVGLFTEDYPSLKDRQTSKIGLEFPDWLGAVKETQDKGLGFHLNESFGGGSILLRNLDDPSKYRSAEFAAVGVDELTQNQVDVFNILRGSLRWPGIPNKRCPFIAATNPDGPGHNWVKQYWITGDLPKELWRAKHEFVFVPSLPDDNPFLDAGYWEELESLPPDLARAWRYGDWDAFEGQCFSSWRRALHVIPPFELPSYYYLWRAVDWGYASPFCCLWLARDPDIGRVYVVQEVYQTGLTDRQQARLIVESTPPEWKSRINLTFADPSMWERKNLEGRVFSTADEYRAEGVVLVKGDNNRVLGKRKIDNMLAMLPDGKPGLQVFDTCPNLIRTLPALPRDKRNPELWSDRAEDHAADTLKYGLSNVSPRPDPIHHSNRPVVIPSTDSLYKRLRIGAGLAGIDF